MIECMAIPPQSSTVATPLEKQDEALGFAGTRWVKGTYLYFKHVNKCIQDTSYVPVIVILNSYKSSDFS